MKETQLEKCNISDAETRTLREDLHELMAIFPTNKVFNIVLEYLRNDKKIQEFLVYIQSEEFPEIHRVVEYLQQYKDVSAFMYMFLMHESDRENICSVPTSV